MKDRCDYDMANAWQIVSVAVAINLLCGFGYAWSLFKVAIRQSIETGGTFNWDLAALNDPYAAFNLVFAFSTILTGRLYDRWGPKSTTFFGMLCVGSGQIICGLSSSYWAWVIGWGLLAPFGIAWGYAATTPTVIKWFPPEKSGFVTGIVVAGAGIAPVYIAPLVEYFLRTLGPNKTLLVMGAYTGVIGSLCALFLSNPGGSKWKSRTAKGGLRANLSLLLKSSRFWRVWFLYFVGGGVGLMVVGSMAGMATKALGKAAFIAVAVLAIGNALGRVGGGYISDRIGRRPTLLIVSIFQAVLMAAGIQIVGSETVSVFILVLFTALVGFNYGTNVLLFPTITKDLWGIENLGLNYGLVLTAWGSGGFVMARISQTLLKLTGTYDASFLFAAILLVIATILAFFTRLTADSAS